MTEIDQHAIIDLEFELRWQSSEANHVELYYGPTVNMCCDIFPAAVQARLLGSKINDQLSFSYAAGEIVPPYNEQRVMKLHREQFRRVSVNNIVLAPKPGRFYPGGLLQGVPGIQPQTMQPFRVVSLDKEYMTVDLNHPLSRYAIEVLIKTTNLRQPEKERGGSCNDWFENITANGPGMQARQQEPATRFETAASYIRQEETDDALFYNSPRLTNHVDNQASSMIKTFYSKHLQREDTVLVLMSSVQSHLPPDLNLQVTGLGLNETELKANPALQHILIQDLNSKHSLPFPDYEFNAVVCSLSIEYLINPRKVVSEIHRVLKPNGRILISFSNRWFPPKVTRLWTEIHDFERMGLVLDYLIEEKGFHNLKTYSARNWPRPADDPYSTEIMNSDPVFVVTADKKRNDL